MLVLEFVLGLAVVGLEWVVGGVLQEEVVDGLADVGAAAVVVEVLVMEVALVSALALRNQYQQAVGVFVYR